MSERKLKCARCGKWFKAADYKHLLCPACTLAERQKRQQAAPAPTAGRPGPRIAAPAATAGVPPRQEPAAAANGRVAPLAVAPAARVPPPAAPPVAPPRQLSEAQRQAVERRYLELATPQEFDGIRRQIAAELGLPRSLVKAAVNDLRQRQGIPSWWDLQQGELPAALVEAVKERYLPLLPLPPVGVHRILASELQRTNLQVYRAIGQIRRDLGLPKFNEREDSPPPEGAAAAQPAAAPGPTVVAPATPEPAATPAT